MKIQRHAVLFAALMTVATVGACAKRQPPVARVPTPPEAGAGDTANRPATPPTPVTEPRPIPPEPTLGADDISARDIGDINKNSPFQPVFFALDSSDVDAPGQQALNANAEILKKYPTWVITIEGHADERGTAEYNLALGERRAMAARTYLVSLGIPANRLRTVSYGKEFPFDPGHTEESWRQNRRAQFVLTSK